MLYETVSMAVLSSTGMRQIMTDDSKAKALEAFESLVRMFGRMAYLGGLFVVASVMLAFVLKGPARTLALFLFGCGALMIFVGRREYKRGTKIIAERQEGGDGLNGAPTRHGAALGGDEDRGNGL
jgi:hypothetical protein